MKSIHQQYIELFMGAMGQYVPNGPTKITPETARLRARLIMEEALETIAALGYRPVIKNQDVNLVQRTKPNFIEVVDGCCDLSVVTIGTLSALGVHDLDVLSEVDANNIMKIANATLRDDGKIIKAANHPKPDLAGAIRTQNSTT